MADARRLGRLDAALRVAAALLGSLAASLLVAACLGRSLPLTESARFTVSVLLVLPLWVAGMCAGLLARRGLSALWVCGALALLFVLVSAIAPP